MTLMIAELRKVIKEKWIWISCIGLLIGSMLCQLYFIEKDYVNKNMSASTYCKIADTYSGMSLIEAEELLQEKVAYNATISSTLMLYRMGYFTVDEAIHLLVDNYGINISKADFIKADLNDSRIEQELLQEVKGLKSYNENLIRIKEGEAGLSTLGFFNKSDYLKKENAKVKEDYYGVDVVIDNYANQFSVRTFLNSGCIDFFVVIFLLILVIYLSTDEEEKGYYSLTKTLYKGRKKHYTAKLLLLFFTVTLVTVLFYGAYLAVTCLRYTSPAWNEPIQTAGYVACTYNLCVFEAIVYFLALKIVMLFIIAATMMFMATLSKKSSILIGSVFLIAFLGYKLYDEIDFQSTFVMFKVVNPVMLIDSEAVLLEYHNLNIFGTPISFQLIVFVALLVLGVISCLVGRIIYSRKILKQRHKTLSLISFIRKNYNRFNKLHFHTNIFRNEWKKNIISYKLGLPILIWLCIVVLYYFNADSIVLSRQEIFYQEYMEELNGPLTADKIQYLNAEKNKFENLDELKQEVLNDPSKSVMLIYIEEMMAKRDAFMKVMDRYQYILDNPNVNSFVYEEGHHYLLGTKERQDTELFRLFGMVFLIIVLPLSSCIEYRKNADNLISTTFKGKKHARDARMLVQYIVAILVMFSVYLGNTYVTAKQFGIFGHDLSVTHLQEYTAWFPLKFNVYWLLMVLLRLIIIAGIVFINEKITRKYKDYIKSVILFGAVLLCFFLIQTYIIQGHRLLDFI